jgi:outer membrane protein assembly factor BamB
MEVGAGVSLPPVVANSTLYILDDNARLHAFR